MAWQTNSGKVAHDAAKRADDAAMEVQQVIDKAQAVTTENKTRFLNAVATVAERDSKYPNPIHGDTVRTTSTAKTFRFVNGTGWVITDEYNPTAIDNITAQLAETANQVTEKMDRNTTGISVAQIDKNKGKFDQTYMSDEFLQQMAGATPINAVPADKSLTTKKYVERSVIPQVTSFARTKNLFDGIYKKGVGLAGSGFSSIVYSTNPTTFANAISAIIRLEKGKTYTVSKSNDTNRFGIVAFIGEPQPSQAPDKVFNLPAQIASNPFTFTLVGEQDFVVIYVSNDAESKEPSWLQIEEGSEATKPNAISINFQNKSIPTDAIDYSHDYIISDVVNNYKTETSFIPRSTANSAASIYAEYDRLMSESAGYITKELLGNETTGLPIYIYKFRPALPQNQGINFRNPKILFISGTHGQEDRAILETLRFFSDLVRNWKNNDALRMLKWNVDFDVIPVLNPYGLNNKQRKNAKGVDINRNFPTDWIREANVDSPYYGGASSLSEVESQILDNYLKGNKDNLIFAVDYHKYNTLASDGHATWMGTTKGNIQKVLASVARYTNATLKTDYPFIDQTNNNLTSISLFDEPGVIHKHFIRLNIPGIILETVWNIGGVWDEQDEFYVEGNSQRFSVDLIGNLILAAVRQYKELRF